MRANEPGRTDHKPCECMRGIKRCNHTRGSVTQCANPATITQMRQDGGKVELCLECGMVAAGEEVSTDELDKNTHV